MTVALSDYLFFQRRYINILTYLLTYSSGQAQLAAI